MTPHRHLLALAASAVTLTSCTPAWLTQTTLTANGTGVYNVTGDLAAITITAPGDAGGNHREALTPTDASVTVNQTTCATWVDGLTTVAQPGLVLRLDVPGKRAVTVTKNVWAQVYSTVNVHTWQLTGPDEQRYTQVGSFPFVPALHTADGGYQAGPWRACATAQGATVTVRVWPTSRPEPAPGDPCCGGTVTLPAVWSGKPGWYAGHIPAGKEIRMKDLVAGPLP